MTEQEIRSGVFLNNEKCRRLVPLLEGWITAVTKYSNVHRDDNEAGYAYNERASISLLTAGAWISGKFVALEEYGTQKKHDDGYKHGRSDLYVTDKKYSVGFEAKQRWIPSYVPQAKFMHRARDALSEALRDARKVKDAEAQFGCVFYVPSFRQADYPKSARQRVTVIQQEIMRYLEIKSPDAWAWCFPSATRNVSYEAQVYPGVLLALKCVRSAKF